MDYDGAVVLDNGSGSMKVGFAGDDCPRSLVETISGRPKIGREYELGKDLFVGQELDAKREFLTLKYPMQNGVIVDWESMEKMWEYMYESVSAIPDTLPFVITEAPLNPFENRSRMSEIFFEKFRVPGFSVQISGVLSLFASGRCSGTVLDCGETVTQTISIYESFAHPKSISNVHYGGRNLNDYLLNLTKNQRSVSSTSCESEAFREAKEQLCYVAVDENDKQDTVKEYELPDGKILLGEECFSCPEALFDPSLMEIHQPGVHELVFDSIKKCGLDTRRDLLCNVVISGGSTLFSGFSERLNAELYRMVSEGVRVHVVSAPERKFLPWIGGSIIASLSSFQSEWVTKDEYEENGPSALKEKCRL